MTPDHVLASLVQLQRDPEPMARAVGAALTAAVLDALDDDERRWIRKIELLRAGMEASTELIDTALPNARGLERPAPLGDTCSRRSKKRSWGTFLLALARTLAPERALELGTGLGISTAYLGAGLQLTGGGEAVTIEGAPALAERSARNLHAIGLHNTEVVPGMFAATLDDVLERIGPLGLAFIDGHHQEEPTLRYFDQISAHLNDPAVVVFDDIRWSEGMERAWSAILADRRVVVAIDLESVGVCVVGRSSESRARHYRLATVTALQSGLAQTAPADPPEWIVVPRGGIARLNWGCGERGAPGWINSDIKRGPGVDITVDIRHGLPIDDDSLDYAVSIHALPMLSLPDLVGVLCELRRVLKPGGTLRLGLPDLERGVAAWQRGDRGYFLVPDSDAETLSGKLITQLLWYGYTVTLFTKEFIEELLRKAGFDRVHHCSYRQSGSGHEGITELDNRENESLYVEAVK
jgi:predicted O-methyltransferase YrrM